MYSGYHTIEFFLYDVITEKIKYNFTLVEDGDYKYGTNYDFNEEFIYVQFKNSYDGLENITYIIGMNTDIINSNVGGINSDSTLLYVFYKENLSNLSNSIIGKSLKIIPTNERYIEVYENIHSDSLFMINDKIYDFNPYKKYIKIFNQQLEQTDMISYEFECKNTSLLSETELLCIDEKVLALLLKHITIRL